MARSGIVALTVAVKHICHILVTYRNAVDTVLDAAVASETITADQRLIAANFLDLATGACDIFRLVSGY